ncbi:HAD hydrolase-like protein [Leptospira sp. 2 VSF19]|uniref:phosphoglycolate phosphatase n=1 Tax=Leptospira soteropolitanensis TaxID=2950025 RepID=A0AAW5VE11_9LEPT|nr:HAD hydrolase-like protein [Leptospira soteropolitanensis]MCW7493167.1 HAD hydrolase-like protein [Leptospira soteropolitanensis]MCW7500764.1 HAD hydrolase-like protein [Leptospira soteropolitanensis]MCW7523017.1 HAD hydrolase-like protein [Leptospira soteropolitanensis]MCW7526876.1 HAD hydrolase-like protein [Leptospira soteropolitanensis]MCW7530735.1 HAD hydrolase-like protein [Leptospira soteropolitanensis]
MAIISLKEFKLIFWDFDGVIKDSVDVKTDAYLALFPKAPKNILEQIKSHHLEYGGISRLEKIPLYLDWVGIYPTDQVISQYLDQFANLVVQKVISSPWVPGVEQLLKQKLDHQKFVIVTGTPQKEIEEILLQLEIVSLFDHIFGAPTKKPNAIQWTLQNHYIQKEDSILIGDSKTDWLAANETGIQFLLRETNNSDFSVQYSGNKLKDFVGFI